MISEHALATIRSHVAEAFKAGTKTFPHYTLHGAEHLDELDRLARLLGGALGLDDERLALLRLACILHDYAMVQVPNPEREAELRERWGPELSFADLVRKVHQDEIEEVLSQPAKLDFLSRTLSEGGGHVLDDAVTIAKHHRFHPLDQAPEHLRDLCALMRIADELDIGPQRAPLSAYEALRERMEPVARFHWLKHRTTRPVRDSDTFVVEQRGERRVLKVIVATKATEETWQLLQNRIIDKLDKCLHEEGVNDVLAGFYRARVEVKGGKVPEMSGVTWSLPPMVAGDLEELASSGFLDEPSPPAREPVVETSPSPPPATVAAPRSTGVRREELRIVAIPPETLPEALCLSGRLSVIGNTFIPREEKHVGGVPGADSRIYVGPADCGKTRSAMEWIADLTEGRANEWVVLRTDMGWVPERSENIVLDTSAFEANGYLVPQKAVLFLDDLPVHLPPPTPDFSRIDAIRTIFQWFAELPHFRERRLVGTIRVEDLTSVPDWPDALPKLGRELELIGLDPVSQKQYVELWEGMTHGQISRSLETDVETFSLGFSRDFLERVSHRDADPEAVATFVREMVSRKEKIKKLHGKAAERFSDSAVGTWRTETWPAIFEAYGTMARVFFTLARFFEAGLRPDSGYLTNLFPQWGLHEGLGPALCERLGEPGDDYLATLFQLMAVGHAVGQGGEWLRPKFDFVLQAGELPGVEVELPSQEWFIEHAVGLTSELRKPLAQHLAAASGEELPQQVTDDAAFAYGWGYGLAAVRRPVAEDTEKAVLLSRALECFQAAVEADPKDAQAWYNLGVVLERAREEETRAARRAELLDEKIAALRTAVEANPQDARAWSNLGVALGQAREEETEATRRAKLLDERIDALRTAVKVDPKLAPAWSNLGVALGQAREEETEAARRAELLDEEIAAYRAAVEVEPKHAQAWYNLASCLLTAANLKTEQDARSRRLTEVLQAAQKAADLGAGRYNLACALALSGEKDRALEELEGCLARKEVQKDLVRQDPDWKGLRGDPELEALLE